MLRILGAIGAALLGAVLLLAGLQEYRYDPALAQQPGQDGITFVWGFHDPVFVVVGAALIVVGVVVAVRWARAGNRSGRA